MARYTGAVRFADGEQLYFAYNGTVDQCHERLYRTVAEAEANWDETPLHREAARTERESAPPERSEVVEVMPYFSHEQKDVMFMSRADRHALVITGPLSTDEEAEEYLKQNQWPW